MRLLRSRWTLAALVLLAAAIWVLLGLGDHVTGQPSADPYR